MTCAKRDGLITVQVQPHGNTVAVLDNQRRLLAIPVRWHPHYFYKCESWTFDLRTWRHYRPSFDLVHVHLVVADVSIIYAIAAGTFEQGGHSSYTCCDRKLKDPERLHCPKELFRFDRELEARYPPSPYVEQARMVI